VLEPQARQRVIDECLLPYLHDSRDAWDLQPDGSYKRAKGAEDGKGQSAQVALMQRYAAPPGDEEVRTWT